MTDRRCCFCMMLLHMQTYESPSTKTATPGLISLYDNTAGYSIRKSLFVHRYDTVNAMNTVTISRKIAGGTDDLVVISRREYENLLRTRARARGEVPMTADEKRALARARKNMKAGKMLSLEDVKRRLASRN